MTDTTRMTFASVPHKGLFWHQGVRYVKLGETSRVRAADEGK